MTLLHSSKWRNRWPFSSILLNFTSQRALRSHTVKSGKICRMIPCSALFWIKTLWYIWISSAKGWLPGYHNKRFKKNPAKYCKTPWGRVASPATESLSSRGLRPKVNSPSSAREVSENTTRYNNLVDEDTLSDNTLFENTISFHQL